MRTEADRPRVGLRTARAAVVRVPGATDVVDVDVVEPGPHEVRIRVEGCGVCGSNLPVWQGRPWFTYPLPPGAPGHEGWGHVVAVGDDVARELQVGTRVAMLGEQSFAESVVVPAADVVPLPERLGFGSFPGEAFGCGFNVAARSDFRPGQTVAVVGIGFLGAIVVNRAVAAGARVIAVSRRPFALEVARAMGAHETVPMGGDDVTARVLDLTDGAGCDRVVEAVGVQSSLDLAGALTAERGRLVIAGFHQDGPRTVDMQSWNWRGIDVVNAHERDPRVVLQGITAAADAVACGELDPAPLLTHSFPLDRLGDAMQAMVERPDGFLKAVVTS